MRTSHPCFARSARLVLSLILVGASLSLSLATAAASASSGGPYHASSAPVPRALALAAAAATRADRLLVAEAHALRQCVSAHPRSCAARHGAVQSAGHWLALAERQMARLARATAHAASASRRYGPAANPRHAPRLYVLGRRLVWSRVARVGKYVLRRTVPGQGDQFLLIGNQSFTPPVVPGTAVTYSVRTAVRGSTWSDDRAIDYPPATTPSGAPNPGADPDRRAAPALAVSGQTLSWHSVAGVGTYVLVTYVAGRAPAYSEVSGTSVAPPSVPGTKVGYSVRTAVDGSAWAQEVSISYPAAPAPAPAPTPPPAPGGGEPRSGMTVSLDTGGWSWASAVNDAAGAVTHFRAAFKYYNSDSQMELLAKAGVHLMPLFGQGGTLAEYNNPAFFSEIVSWFKRYGHGGSFWAGKPADLGATTCELINEPGNPYFYPDAGNYQLYAGMTKAVHSALEANFAPAVRPKLLVSYDGGFSGSSYGRALFAAGAVADAVTVHPYGGHGGGSEFGNRERVTQAHAETGLPVYVTEIGWPTALGMQPTGDSLQWSEQRQAENISSFMGWARSLGYVADVTYFNYADYGPNDYYGIVNSTGSVHKLSYQALRTAAAAG